MLPDVIIYPVTTVINYRVYKDGRVYSERSKRFLIPQRNSNGYLHFRLGKKFLSIHRIIAKAFIPNPTNLPVVNHKNGIRDDNRLENLEWCTQKQNIEHALRIGNMVGNKGTENGNSKLAEMDVLLIRAMIELGERKSDIADWFGIERYYVHRIKNRTNWKHI